LEMALLLLSEQHCLKLALDMPWTQVWLPAYIQNCGPITMWLLCDQSPPPSLRHYSKESQYRPEKYHQTKPNFFNWFYQQRLQV
jgi:hypothetical protein